MENIEQLDIAILASPDFIQKMEAKIKEIIDFHNQDKEALFYALKFKNILARTDLIDKPQLQAIFQKWHLVCAALSLAAHKEETIIDFFKNNLLELLDLGEDVILSQADAKLAIMPAGPAEEFSLKLTEAMQSNQQKLGELTFGEWLALYTHHFADVLEIGDLELKQFLEDNGKIKSLKLEEREKIVLFFKIYNLLRPFNINAYYIREILQKKQGGVLEEQEKMQARLGQALAKNMPNTVFRGTQDIRDTRPREARMMPQIARSSDGAPGAPMRSQSIKQTPTIPAAQEVQPPSIVRENNIPAPAIPLNKNFVQRPLEAKTQIVSLEITIATLEAAAEKGDPIEEERLRKIIRQDFNKLSEEVRQYIVNSPFWAE